MKSYVLLFVVFAALLGLSACDSKKEAKDEKKATTEEKAKEGEAPAEDKAVPEEGAEEGGAAAEAGATDIEALKKAAAEGTVEVGGSCAGLGALDALMSCVGQKRLFCSSYSEYKWTMTQECPEGQSCHLAADGKSGGCEVTATE